MTEQNDFWNLPFYDCKLFRMRNVTIEEATNYIIKNRITLYGSKTDNCRFLVKIPKYVYEENVVICKDYLILDKGCSNCNNEYPTILYNNLQIKTTALKTMLNEIKLHKETK